VNGVQFQRVLNCLNCTVISIIVNRDQQDATILAYLFIPNHLYMSRTMSSPIIRSNWLYLQLLILSTDIAAGCCHGWDGTHRRWSSFTI